MTPENPENVFHRLGLAVRRAVAEEKKQVEKADRDALMPHILAQLLDASHGVPTLEATCAIVRDTLKRVRAAEPAWDARRIAQNDECLRLAAVAYWTPERRDAGAPGRRLERQWREGPRDPERLGRDAEEGLEHEPPAPADRPPPR